MSEIFCNLNFVFSGEVKFEKHNLSKYISPLSASSRPEMIFNSVDFPAPEGPEIDKESPESKVNEISRSTSRRARI